MQYAVNYEKENAPTHLVSDESQRPVRVQDEETGKWAFRSVTACGSIVFGSMGHAAYKEFVTCGKCRRTRQYKEY